MKKTFSVRNLSATCVIVALGTMGASAQTIVSTDAYVWRGDSIIQGEYFATAPTSTSLTGNYKGQPHYFMPIDGHWTLKNDISSYPQFKTPNRLHEATYNLALDEMVNAVEPDTTLRTGKEWAGVWTRDVSYSILLSMAYLQPEASIISLMKKVDPLGRIIQDTGSGGAWPISTDREIWAVAAYEVYKVTGDKDWLKTVYPIVKRSLETDKEAVWDLETRLMKGETSFIDWREQSHPKWMQTADVYNTEALSTNLVHAQAWQVLSEMAEILGHKKEAKEAADMARQIRDAVNKNLWNEEKGYYDMYLYGRDNLIANPRADALGEGHAILWGAADEGGHTLRLAESMPITKYGPPVFYPQISDMPSYHNNGLWPWVASWWTLAAAKAGSEQGVLEGIGSVIRPAALFGTNKENLNLDNGDIATELNSSNMLWCLSGNLALTHKILFGITFEKDGLAFKPFVPEALGQTRTLSNFKYRNSRLDITVEGYGDKVKEFYLDGKLQKDAFLKGDIKGDHTVRIVMDSEPIKPVGVNNVPNVKAPLTPITWLDGTTLTWDPIEYIGEYIIVKDGERIARTHSTTFDASTPGEYMVIGVSGEGVEGFASQPRSTRPETLLDLPGETLAISSSEVSYRPNGQITGYSGRGWVETDKKTAPVKIEVDVPEMGDYAISFSYANGNGPVNTENKAAIRTLTVDGHPSGTIVLPQRGVGNWSDWGWSNSVTVQLKAGKNTIGLEFLPQDQNMNIQTNHALLDRIRLVKTNN